MMHKYSHWALMALGLTVLMPSACAGQSAQATKAAKTVPTDPASGLIIDDNWVLVKTHCTACHSAKLVSQNRMTRARWLDTIRWMQDSEGLWPLADAEPKILDYLSKNYGAKTLSRKRKNLPRP